MPRPSREEIEKYLAAETYEELSSHFPQYPEPTAEQIGCPMTSPEEIKRKGGLTGVPIDIEALVYSRKGVPREHTREDILRMAREELRRKGITNVAVRVRSYLGYPFGEARATAATWKHAKRKGFLVHIHPDLLWYPEEYIRDTIRHEIEHTLREQDWK